MEQEKSELRWIRCGFNSMHLDQCIREAQPYDKQPEKKVQSIFMLYDLLCAIQSEYPVSPLVWHDLANHILSYSKSFVSRLSLSIDSLRILEIYLATAFLLDEEKLIQRFAIRFTNKYEQAAKQKLFTEFDYDGEDDEFLIATSLYLLCRFISRNPYQETDNLIPSGYQSRRRNTHLIKRLQQLLMSIGKNNITSFTKNLQEYLNRYVSREHYGMSYLYRHYSPLASILYSLASKTDSTFYALDKKVMKLKMIDLNVTLKLKTYSVYATDLTLSSRLLSAVHREYPTARISSTRRIARKKRIIVPLEAETIESALQLVNDGGTILLKPGQYDLSEILNIKKNVTIKGDCDNPEGVVLLNERGSVMIIAAPKVTLRNLTLANSDIYTEAVIINEGNVHITNCKITSQEKTGILVNGRESQLQIKDSVIDHCRGYGVAVHNAAKITAHHCVISNCICSFELSDNSECRFHNTQLSGTTYLHDETQTTMTSCAISSITAVNKSTASLIGCHIHLLTGNIAAGDQSEILCSKCLIKSVNKTLPTVYATTASLITLQKCSVTTPRKKYIYEEQEGQVKVSNEVLNQCK